MDRKRFFQLLAPASLLFLVAVVFVKAEAAATPATAAITIVERGDDKTGVPGGFPNSSAQRIEQAAVSKAILSELRAIRQQLERGAIRVDLDVEALATALRRFDDTEGVQAK